MENSEKSKFCAELALNYSMSRLRARRALRNSQINFLLDAGKQIIVALPNGTIVAWRKSKKETGVRFDGAKLRGERVRAIYFDDCGDA